MIEIILFIDTWGSHSKPIKKSSYGSAPSSGKSTPLPQPTEVSSSSSSGKGGRKTSGTRSGSTSRSNSRSNSTERRRSSGTTDDTASPTRKPALFDAFRPRSKSDASKRKPSIIANMKSAVQVKEKKNILKMTCIIIISRNFLMTKSIFRIFL